MRERNTVSEDGENTSTLHRHIGANMRTRRRSPSPEPEEEMPLLGNTRGAAKDASERVKAQAVLVFWKKVSGGMKKMAAYAFAGP